MVIIFTRTHTVTKEQVKRFNHILHRFGRQVKELKKERKVMEARIPIVEEELDKLTEDLMSQGWGEAYAAEWDSLNNRTAMVRFHLFHMMKSFIFLDHL